MVEFRWQESQADLDALLLVLADVYRRGKPVDPPQLKPDEIGAIGLVDGRVGAGFLVMDMQVSRRAATLPCAGVAAVGVLPEARHGGLGSAMMRWSLAAMRDRGYDLACLYPFRETYYGKFGYATAGVRVMIECPRDRMPDLPMTLPVRRIAPENVADLDSALVPYARRHSGVNLRSADNWQRRLGETPPMIYAFGEPAQAYLWTSLEGMFWDDLTVGELIYATREGYESALGFLRTLGINRGAISWRESSLSPFVIHHLDSNVKVSYDRLTMWRVLDVPRTFGRLQTNESGSFCFALTDDLLPDNAGTWRVNFSPAGVTIEPGSDPDFSLDIRQLSPAFLGQPSLREFAELGLIQVHRPERIAEAERLLSPTPTLCPDFF
ncbi:MAG: GNAT family N-acetyltransferase [Chthonomonas sp.]|nr:GNAT family N-acetyltransferase [Chthonomonas sp.]